VGYARQPRTINKKQLADLIGFHLHSALLPLWRNEELNAHLNRLHKLKKLPLTLEELTEKVESLEREIKNIQNALISVSKSFSKPRFDDPFDDPFDLDGQVPF
jgi:hypothetical protein